MIGNRPHATLRSVAVRVQALPYRHVRLPRPDRNLAGHRPEPAPVRFLRLATFHLRAWLLREQP